MLRTELVFALREIVKSHIAGRLLEDQPDVYDPILLIGVERATDLEIIQHRASCELCGCSPEMGSALDTIIERASSVEHFYVLCTDICTCTPQVLKQAALKA